jgi:dihydropteroate synthase
LLGIINVTPDSFSDAGASFSSSDAVEHAATLLREGADVLDIGGESTRPQGATPVDAAEELRRILPVIGEIVARFPDATISIDTVKAVVADAALRAGAHIVNDVSAGRLDPEMHAVCARHGAGVILMHSRGAISDMASYANAEYDADPVAAVLDELGAAAHSAMRQGVERGAIAIDPGLGFSKRTEHSVAMLRGVSRLATPGFPLVVGVSRKRFIGELSGEAEPTRRVFGGIAANVVALGAGAMLFRVHDVLANRQALDVAWGIMTGRSG